jgi:hypothetical protein
MTINIPSHLSDIELVAEVKSLARGQRQVTAQLIAHLAEFDGRPRPAARRRPFVRRLPPPAPTPAPPMVPASITPATPKSADISLVESTEASVAAPPRPAGRSSARSLSTAMRSGSPSAPRRARSSDWPRTCSDTPFRRGTRRRSSIERSPYCSKTWPGRSSLRPSGRAQARGTAPGSRDLAAKLRRAVWLRDGGHCAFRSTGGRRCNERAFVDRGEPTTLSRTSWARRNGHAAKKPVTAT